MGKGEAAFAGGPRRLSDVLRERRDEIEAQWEARVRRLRAAERLARPVLLDHVPDFLLELSVFVDVVRAAVGLTGEASGFRLRIGEGFAGRVAAEQRPLFGVGGDEVRNPELRARATRALYGVPLLHGGDLMGVALMGSSTAYDFSDE